MLAFADVVARDPEIKDALINIEAWGLSARINKNAVAIFAQNGLLLIELHTKPQILFFAQEMGDISRPDSPGAGPDEPACATIARLESDLATERALRLKLTDERDALKNRLATLEQHLKSRSHPPSPADARYTKLKNFLAKEFHPDHARGSDQDRRWRADFFKTLWAKVEDIDKT